MKFRAQDLHTMTATIRTQTRDVTSFWYWQSCTHRHRTVNGLSENDKIRILTIQAWRKHGYWLCTPWMWRQAASSPTRRYIFTMQLRTELNWITQLNISDSSSARTHTHNFTWSQYAYRTQRVCSWHHMNSGKQQTSILFDITCSDGWIGACEALLFTSAAVSTAGTAYSHCARHCPTIITHYWKSFHKQTFWSRLQKLSRQTAYLFCSNKRFNDDDSNSDPFSHYKINFLIKHARHNRHLTRTNHFTSSQTLTKH